ncbi:DUF1285 domain-containing protein [Acetobacteraceae bacterium]|nr:DUF1285 domain-containing protein [Acetobacteraceae bacterium]
MTSRETEESCLSKLALIASIEDWPLADQCLCDIGGKVNETLPFRIARNGCWYYKSQPVKDRRTQQFLASLLIRDLEGNYFLETPSGRGLIEVEDVPYLAVRMKFSGLCEKRQAISLMTNIGEIYCVGPEHPLFCHFNEAEGTASVYLQIAKAENGAPLLARLTKAVIFELGAVGAIHQVNGKECMGVWSRGAFFPIPCAF